MNRPEALALWAPADSPWSPWTKPVLFSFLPEETPDAFPPVGHPPWQVPFVADAALLVDLPGAEGLELGVDLARVGYRPIPLYNACPYPFPPDTFELPLPVARPLSTVNVVPILEALGRQTGRLREIVLPPAAPPAFLLDARRHHPALPAVGSLFDNRSVVRESDLPTAAFLRAHGLRQLVLVQLEPNLPHDLRVVLRGWQAGGLAVARQIVGQPWTPQTLVLPRLWWLRAWWDKLLQPRYPFRPDGAFGRFVPSHGSSG